MTEQKLLSQTTPTARTEHPCGWCVEPITPGLPYIRCTYAYDGSVFSYSLHEECFRAESDAEAYNAPEEGEPVCYNSDARGGSHERGKNCPECSDEPIRSRLEAMVDSAYGGS